MSDKMMFAADGDQQELELLLLEYGMGLAGEIEEHILVKRDNDIVAGALITAVGDSLFHLAVLAVRPEKRGQGLGRQLLQQLLNQPEKYCYGSVSASSAVWQMTTVARGVAVDFYKANGFVACDFSDLIFPYQEQCAQCPEKESCNPIPMIFSCSEK